MSTQYTSPYNIPYPQSGDPVREGYARIEGIAKRVNQVLMDGSFPASTPDIAALTTRMNALEFATVAVASKVSAGTSAVTLNGTAQRIPYTLVGSDFVEGPITRETSPLGRFTIQRKGIYAVTVAVGTAGAATSGGLKVFLRVNGSNVAASEEPLNASAWVNTNCHFDALKLNVGDYVECWANLTGTATTIGNSGETTYLTIAMVKSLL